MPEDPRAPATGAGARAQRHYVTIKDVARAAGVSQSTTSRAMSGEGYVAAAVRQRVLAVAEELGYVPHAMARGLRKQVSRSIGVLVPDLRNPFAAHLAAGIASRARSRGYTMMVVDDEGDPEEELAAARVFVSTRAAGVIVTPASAAVGEYLLQQQVPVVETDRRFLPDRCDGVVVDNEVVARRMTDHLLSLGHRRIALLVDEAASSTGEDRVAGYRRALAESGARAPLVVPVGVDADAARLAAVDLLARGDAPTAVFTASSPVTEGVWRATRDLGLRVPEDLSVVAFDDARWMSMVEPGITAIAQDAVGLGRAAVDRLLERLDEPAAPPRTVVLEATIVPRGSTAAPRAASPAGPLEAGRGAPPGDGRIEG
jgi:LacI family transcriptional regulator